MEHEIRRVRRDVVQRSLRVARREQLTPRMLRLVLAGDELAGFDSPSPDDHVKVFVQDAEGREARRDYTPRAHDPTTRELTLDFALHEAGPATRWAMEAQPGDTFRIGGPRGSVLVPDDFDWWLLIGDETAIPAIARRLETVTAPVTALVAVTGPEEEQSLGPNVRWIHRARADDPVPLMTALAQFEPPPGDGFVWIAAEGGVARALRAHVLGPMGHRPQWLRASGYWVRGRADVSETLNETV